MIKYVMRDTKELDDEKKNTRKTTHTRPQIKRPF